MQQLNGADPLVERLAKPHLDRVRFPNPHQDDDWEDSLKAMVAAELAKKLLTTETTTTPVAAGAMVHAGRDPAEMREGLPAGTRSGGQPTPAPGAVTERAVSQAI